VSGLSVILFDVVLIVVTMSALTWLESRGVASEPPRGAERRNADG